MNELFTELTHAIEGTAWIALTAAFIWGILSVLLSPCHLASIPLIVGLVDQQQTQSKKSAFIQALLFSTGILLSIAIIGLITTAAGRILGDIGRYGGWIAVAIFFVMGLQLLGVISSPWKKPERTTGQTAALLTGLIFGIALGPCTFAFMAPILAMTFKLSAEVPIYAWSLVLLYGLGHCAIIVLAGTSAEVIRTYLNWNQSSKGAMRLRKICGILILLAGHYILTTVI
ncbi:MAG: cytochrome c biogenesis protein CcdA [Kiritimatiellaceae bacterium]|nr:cytochrome c biogenesis protein CcdA [Kiritimatiellaceae bacterium]